MGGSPLKLPTSFALFPVLESAEKGTTEWAPNESQKRLCSGFVTSWCGLRYGTTRASADQFAAGQIIGPLGRTDGTRLPRGDPTFAGHVPVAIRHSREAWATHADWLRSAQCALRGTACRRATICRGLSGVLFWPNLRGAS